MQFAVHFSYVFILNQPRNIKCRMSHQLVSGKAVINELQAANHSCVVFDRIEAKQTRISVKVSGHYFILSTSIIVVS